MISNLIACYGKWDRCAIASQLLRLSSVVSWAEIQVEEDALAYAIYRDIRIMISLGTTKLFIKCYWCSLGRKWQVQVSLLRAQSQNASWRESPAIFKEIISCSLKVDWAENQAQYLIIESRIKNKTNLQSQQFPYAEVWPYVKGIRTLNAHILPNPWGW